MRSRDTPHGPACTASMLLPEVAKDNPVWAKQKDDPDAH
jgi:hypothetical protein